MVEVQWLHLVHNRCLCQLKRPPASPPLLHYPLASESWGKVCGLSASHRACMGDKHRGCLRGVQLSEAAWLPQQQPPPPAGGKPPKCQLFQELGRKEPHFESIAYRVSKSSSKMASRDILGPFDHQSFVLFQELFQVLHHWPSTLTKFYIFHRNRMYQAEKLLVSLLPTHVFGNLEI